MVLSAWMRSAPPSASAAAATSARPSAAPCAWAPTLARTPTRSSAAPSGRILERLGIVIPLAITASFESRRALPALLEVHLPVLRPRPAEKIDEALVERRELRRPPVRPEHDAALDAALDERVAPFRVVDAAGPGPRRDDAQRPRERLGVVEDRLDDQAFAVVGAADDLDHLE